MNDSVDDSLFGWLVREEVLLAGLCERKILFRLEIYDRLRQAIAKRTYCNRPVVSFRASDDQFGNGNVRVLVRMQTSAAP